MQPLKPALLLIAALTVLSTSALSISRQDPPQPPAGRQGPAGQAGRERPQGDAAERQQKRLAERAAQLAKTLQVTKVALVQAIAVAEAETKGKAVRAELLPGKEAKSGWLVECLVGTDKLDRVLIDGVNGKLVEHVKPGEGPSDLGPAGRAPRGGARGDQGGQAGQGGQGGAGGDGGKSGG
jgi:hypothetical protein